MKRIELHLNWIRFLIWAILAVARSSNYLHKFYIDAIFEFWMIHYHFNLKKKHTSGFNMAE